MPQNSNTCKVGFIGAGRMATALARGLISSGFLNVQGIRGCDVIESARAAFTRETGCDCLESSAELTQTSDVVVLAVKPQQAEPCCRGISDIITDQHLIVSIMAGISLKTLREWLPRTRRLIRVMPNTPSLLGCGAAGYAVGSGASEADATLVQRMLSTVGIAVPVNEELLDAVTGLSGSGPAYVFQIIEALSDGGVRVGLPREMATRLAAQTVLGAARMVLETGQHPAALKDAVASPGGTTIAGLEALEAGGMRSALISAVRAATERSKQLSAD